MKAAFYGIILSIPLFMGVLLWQSFRYDALEAKAAGLETEQEAWVEGNKRLIASIAVLSSAERIEGIATSELGLVKKQPEEVLQIRIEGAE